MIVGLVLGIPGIGLLVVALWVLAIVWGHLALGRIKRSNGTFRGKGFAIAGLCIGYGWLVIGVFGAVIAIPTVSQMRVTSQKTMNMNHLRQIVNASLLYAVENDEKLPSSLKDLTEILADPAVFVSTCSGKTPGELSQVDQWSDYTLVPNLTMADPTDSVLVYGDPECWGGDGGYIAFLGGNVAWFERDEFYRMVSGLPGGAGKRD